MVFYLCLSILAAAGLGLLFWCLAGWSVLPFGGQDLQMILTVRGDAENLEQQLRALAWLQSSGLIRANLTLRDGGLSEAGRRLVQNLRNTYDFIF